MTPVVAEKTTIHLPARLCTKVEEALRREWLVTNGLGGFASGTVAGALTRRYHGLLFAAVRPPVGRTLLVAKLDETVRWGGQDLPLSTNVWRDGVGRNPGCRWLRRFELVWGVPTWRYELSAGGVQSSELRVQSSAASAAGLTKRVWMEPGRNVTYVQYELAERGAPLDLTCTLLVNCRDYHALRRRCDTPFEVTVIPAGLRCRAVESDTAAYVTCHLHATPQNRGRDEAAAARWTGDHTWYRDFCLPVEQARGYDHLEDHLCAGHCRFMLQPGQTATFVISVDPPDEIDATTALPRHQAGARERLTAFEARLAPGDRKGPCAVRQLVLAADQFIVRRKAEHSELLTPNSALPGHTIIAGYPWLTDWGRDTMIALPGLTLCTGRFDVARQVLRTWARYVDRGMIPNRFPDRGDAVEYHTADATLWYLWAIDQYARATDDRETVAELFPVLEDIVDWHVRGTRYNLHVAADGLVYAGEPGVNLTWMDAKVGDRVITPRIGKPIELSALWHDGLCNVARLADWLGRPTERFEALARRTRDAFERFWNPARGCCYDVLDGPSGAEPTLRPNQIFAVSLEHSPLSTDQQRAVVATCERELLTWFGLRSLGPREPGYRGGYAGDPVARDEAYHQGTAWGWLLGPFVIAHFRLHHDCDQARRFLEPLLGQLWTHGVGSLSEISDGDPPHEPNGCIAQAWSVAETLRAWCVTQRAPS